MTKPSPPSLFTEIQDAEAPSTRLAALRTLKNEIIGHDQRKASWIQWGIVPVLADILASRRGTGKKSVGRELNGDGQYLKRANSRTDEDEICLQSVIIVGSLAQGGPSYISPIFASNVLPALLQIFSSPSCPQFLTLKILETLNIIADRFPLDPRQGAQETKQLCQLVFSREHLQGFCEIIDKTSSSSTTQSCVALAANLVAKICTEEAYKVNLAEAGVLDALALRLATFVVAQGFVLPGAENHTSDPGALNSLPSPAPPSAQLAPILRAIAVIIEHSKSRADHFLSSPGMVTVFPKHVPDISPDLKTTPWGSPPLAAYSGYQQGISNPIDSILPSVPAAQTKASSNFPPLGSNGFFGKEGRFFTPPLSFSDYPKSDEDESAVVSWLLHVVRRESSLARLMAARVLTILFRLGFAKSSRVPMLGFLLVPLLVRMLDKDYETPQETDHYEDGLISTAQRVKEEAPAILASLVMDSRELQKYAVDGGAIKKLSQMLKESFNPISDNSKPMWDPENGTSRPILESPAEHCLGPPGFSPLLLHKMRFREGILKALASLSLFKEEYRKAICDSGVVPYIIDSMKPCELPDKGYDSRGLAVDGNPTPTLLAACAAARSLTRSVSVLRTSLIDAGVAAPIFTLVKLQNIDVQIAATSVVCNLALDFSPMKESIIKADMIPTLCEHSHSLNAKLRLESLWALKHIMYSSTNDIKMKIVEKLGSGWLKQIICQDPNNPSMRRRIEEDLNGGLALGMGTPNSAGEQVDLLNPIDNGEWRDTNAREDYSMTDATTPTTKTNLDTPSSDNVRRRKLALNGDLDNTKQTRRDDIHVLEQTLDLLRNMICGPDAIEMIDFLFQEFGQVELFNILADKLRPKPLSLYTRKEVGSSKSLPVPTEILSAVTYVIIHIAAGLSRHRHALVMHRDLLRLMVPLFNHSNRQIRVNCVWIIINLTYEDDQSDHGSCQDRAQQLKSIGVVDRLKSLEDDSDPDVRERTKTALNMVNTLLS